MKLNSNIIIDILALILYLVAANPAVTGLLIHEYLSIALLVVFIVHCAAHYDWMLGVLKRHAANTDTANLILDVAALFTFVVVMVSGLMVSRFVVPALGYVARGYFIWNPLHSISAKVLLALLLVHVVVHWRWFVLMLDRYRKKDADEREKYNK